MSEKSSGQYTILPTSYNRKSVKILTNNTKIAKGYEVDINFLVTRVEILENIENSGMEIIVSVGDSENYIEKLRLSGNEKIFLEFERTAHYGKESYLLEYRIIEILNFVKEKRGLTTYQMRCVSPHILSNQVLSKGNSFSGSIGKTVENICRTDLEIPSKKLDIDTATPEVKGIFPRLKPISAINFLTVNCFDDGTPYFFFETFTNGIKFKSLKELFNQKPFDKYFIKETLTKNLESDEGYEEIRTRIVEMSSDYSISKFMGLGKGAFSSTAHLFDVAEKKPYKEEYKYKFDSNTSIEDYKPFPTLDKNNLIKEKTLMDFPQSKNYFINLNSNAFGKSGNYASTQKDQNMGKAYSSLENLEYQTHEILIPGDFRLNVGMVIEIEIPETSIEGKIKEKVNQFQSGKYLITNIVHDLKTGEYNMRVTLKRNSSSIDLDKENEVII